MTADKVLKEIKDAGGIVLKTSLDETKEKALRDALASAAERPERLPLADQRRPPARRSIIMNRLMKLR
jgi:hypothetical protein